MAKRLVGVASPNGKNPALLMTRTDMDRFLTEWSAQGRSETAAANYRKTLDSLFGFLPENKGVTRQLLEKWRAENEAKYSASTVNGQLTAVNAYLDYMNRRDLQFTRRAVREDTEPPTLTRDEYHRLLTAAKVKGDERAYLLVKLFALTGLNVQELVAVTVEAAKTGRLTITIHGVRHNLRIPPVLATDILSYAARQGVTEGPIFLQRNGIPLQRSAATVLIRTLAEDAQVDPEKCNPRALRYFYQAFKSEAEAQFVPLVEETLRRQLEEEQMEVGWGI